MLRGWRLVVPVLVLTALACAHSSRGEASPSNGAVEVEVNNKFALAMDVYALGSGITHRLGTVHPGMSGHFVVPATLISSSVRLEARPSGGGQPFRSGDLLLAPGSVVDFVIAPQVFNSTVTIRP